MVAVKNKAVFLQYVIITYMEDPNTTDQNGLQIAENIEADLTAEELTFTRLLSKGYSGVRAYRLAFPAKKHLKNSTVRVNVSKLLAKTNIITEIQTAQLTQARLARQAENRLEEILTEGSIHSKTNKVAEVSMFMYEQANGKATQKIESKNAHVLVTYDLSGSGEPVPDHIKQQLEKI